MTRSQHGSTSIFFLKAIHKFDRVNDHVSCCWFNVEIGFFKRLI